MGGAWSGPNRLGGMLVVVYLLTMLHALRLLGSLLPKACWVARLERRWTDLWMR